MEASVSRQKPEPKPIQHIIDVCELTPEFIRKVYSRAETLHHNVHNDTLAKKALGIIAAQDSTRTLTSFIAAMQDLGGRVRPPLVPERSSQNKGESFEDTVWTMSGYNNVIVIRHGDTSFPSRAVNNSMVPIINAGNGSDQHPTQYLLDRFAIEQRLGRFEGLTIALVGDLANGRAPRTLALGSAAHAPSNRLIGVPARKLGMKSDVVDYVKSRGVTYSETNRLKDVIGVADVIYMTRLQKEYGSEASFYDDYPRLTFELAQKARTRDLFMHPMPIDRDRELPYEIDGLPQSIYKTVQLRAGLTVRKALLQELLLPH